MPNPYKLIVSKHGEYGDIFRTHEHALSDYLENGFPPHKRILFFDDSILHVDGVHKNCPSDVCSVYIPSRYSFHLNMDSVEFDVKGSNNVYIQEIEKDPHFTLETIAEDNGYRTNGLTKRFSTILNPMVTLPTCVDRIYDWVEKSDHLHERMVFFDWDYVLNQQNGFFLVDSYHGDSYLRLLNDTLIYLFGGVERLHAIQEMLQHLLDHKIKVFIITSNGNADPSARYGVRWRFVDLLQLLFKFRFFDDAHLIYASGSKHDVMNKIMKSEKSIPFVIKSFVLRRPRSCTQ